MSSSFKPSPASAFRPRRIPPPVSWKVSRVSKFKLKPLSPPPPPKQPSPPPAPPVMVPIKPTPVKPTPVKPVPKKKAAPRVKLASGQNTSRSPSPRSPTQTSTGAAASNVETIDESTLEEITPDILPFIGEASGYFHDSFYRIIHMSEPERLAALHTVGIAPGSLLHRAIVFMARPVPGKAIPPRVPVGYRAYKADRLAIPGRQQHKRYITDPELLSVLGTGPDDLHIAISFLFEKTLLEDDTVTRRSMWCELGITRCRPGHAEEGRLFHALGGLRNRMSLNKAQRIYAKKRRETDVMYGRKKKYEAADQENPPAEPAASGSGSGSDHEEEDGNENPE